MQRSVTLDIAKGLLVLVMLVHHAWSAVHVPGEYDAVRSIVSFISSAFILYSGYIFGFMLLDGYIRDPVYRLKRDLLRAFRLWLLFVLCNFMLYFSGYFSLREQFSFVAWFLSCIGPEPPLIAVFSLLNAFAYFFIGNALIIYGVVRMLSGRTSFIKESLIAVMLSITAILYLFFGMGDGGLFSSATIYGFIGVAFGIAAGLSISRYWAAMRSLGLFSMFTYVGLSILALIGFFDPYHYYNLFVFIGAITVWWLALHLAERTECNIGTQGVRYIGKYTLLAYLIQVVVGRCIELFLLPLFQSFGMDMWTIFSLSMLIMGGLMIALIMLVDYLTNRYARVRTIYRTVFG